MPPAQLASLAHASLEWSYFSSFAHVPPVKEPSLVSNAPRHSGVAEGHVVIPGVHAGPVTSPHVVVSRERYTRIDVGSAGRFGTRASETSFGCHEGQPAAGSLTVAHNESVCPLALSCARVTVTRERGDFASGRYAMSQLRL